ncbi:hypothetical protein MUP51_03055 [Candidatus Bathyarchaeota archaeon]|nr:hypothetical protein [Candidatus Bathyarchaeota archaeon]
MYAWGDSELPEEEIDRILQAAAKKIHAYGMDLVAILTLETIKPLTNIGGEIGRMLLSPILPALGPDYNMMGDKLIYIFENKKNVEKLIMTLEEMTRVDEEKKAEKKAQQKALADKEKQKAEDKTTPDEDTADLE